MCNLCGNVWHVSFADGPREGQDFRIAVGATDVDPYGPPIAFAPQPYADSDVPMPSLPRPTRETTGSTEAFYGGIVPNTGNVLIDGLVWGDKWDNTQPIKYYFDDSLSLAQGASVWTEIEKTAYRAALQTWANVANITFQEVFTSGEANFVEFKQNNTANPGSLGQHNVPNNSNQAYGMYNQAGYGWDAAGLQPGGLGFATLVHELGHALGLAHPHDNGGGSGIYPGVTEPQYSMGDYGLNQNIFTIMSYNHGYATLQGGLTSYSYGDASTPMPLDIAAMQAIYGANTTYNGGNNTYVLPTADGAGSAWTGIYDTGGIDTIVNSSGLGATINLQSATLDVSRTGGGSPSYVGSVRGGFTIANSAVIENATGGVAADSITGNLVGNVLDGNGGNDTIIGAGGNDTINGGDGWDQLWGDTATPFATSIAFGSGSITSPGTNTTLGSALNVTQSFSLASNPNIIQSTTIPHVTISGSTGATTVNMPIFSVSFTVGSVLYLDVDNTTNLNSELLLFDSAGTVYAYDNQNGGDPGSNSADDAALSFLAPFNGTLYFAIADVTLPTYSLKANSTYQIHVSVAPPVERGADGTAGNDSIDGGAGFDTISGGAGNDTLLGGTDDDTLRGDAGDDSLIGGTGSDSLDGGEGADVLEGGDGNDSIFGGSGSATDHLYGGIGHDTFVGGAGGDWLYGGAGDDTYQIDEFASNLVEVDDEGIDTAVVTFSSPGTYTLSPNIDYLTIASNGVAGNGEGNGQGNRITGNASNNILSGLGGDDVIFGGFGNDTLDGGANADWLEGGDGADSLLGGVDSVSDSLYGGAGNDTLIAGAGYDWLYGGAGDDTYQLDQYLGFLFEAPGEGTDSVTVALSSGGIHSLGEQLENLTITGNGVATAGRGNSLNNVLIGTATSNNLEGGGGNDSLQGGGGNDTLIGDAIGAGGIVDTLDGGEGDDTYYADSLDIVIEAGGVDHVIANTNYTLGSTLENLSLYYDFAATEHPMIGLGNAVANNVIGNPTDNVLAGLDGNDTINGGQGNDRLWGDNITAVASGTTLAGSGVLAGAPGNSSIATALDVTNLFSLASNPNIANSTTVPHVTVNWQSATAGTNPPFYRVTVTAGTILQVDTDLTSSIDTKLIIYNSSGVQVATNDASGIFDPGSTNASDAKLSYLVTTSGTYFVSVSTFNPLFAPTSSFALHISVEAQQAVGTDTMAGDDSISGGFGDDFIHGGAGNDTIHGEAGSDSLTGGAGDDSVHGGDGRDSLYGGDGNDNLVAGTDTDYLEGGDGNDIYEVETYLDIVIENAGQGTDTVISSSSFILGASVENLTLAMGAGLIDGLGNGENNVITGNDSRNGIAGGGGNDTIYGNGGDDAIDGGIGADSMIGGTGIDTYYVDNTGDTVVETEVSATAYDTVWTNLANYTLPDNVEIYISIPNAGSMNGTGNDGITLMLGNEGNNVLNSLGGNDIVLGGDGNDTINSGLGGDPAGYEVISGGNGADLLTGGGGHDFFNYESLTHGGDIITDFATQAGVEDDILDFRPMFPTFTNIAGITTSAQAVASGHLAYTQVGADVQVFADADGGGDNNVLMATLLNQTAASVQAYTLI